MTSHSDVLPMLPTLQALPFNSRTTLIIVLSVFLYGCLSPSADEAEGSTEASSRSGDSGAGRQPISNEEDEIEILDVPETGINLGWGWNSFQMLPIPTICVEFVEGNEPAQTQSVQLKEVTDNYEVMQHVSGTAEGSYKGFGAEVSGSASFSRDVNINSSATNFLLTASVQNGVRYAAPAPKADVVAIQGIDSVTTRGGTQGAIRLTDEAVRLAGKRNISEFQQMCGDSFVSALYAGAKLTAVISIQTSSRKEKKSLAAKVQGSGWGASVSASAKSDSGSGQEKASTNVSVLLTGGRNESIPTNVEEVIAMSKRLAIAAYEAPKDFHMAVTPYELLANWPGREMLGAESEFDQLADRWGFYISLYDEIQHVLDEPTRYRWPPEEDPDSKITSDIAEHLLMLQDEVLLIIQALGKDAQHCTEEGEDLSDGQTCDFNHENYPDPYRYRVQLPPPLYPPLETDADADADIEDLVTDTLQQQVIDKAKLRCQLDVNNLGCLSNAEIKDLALLIGTRVSPINEMRRPTSWLIAP